jgi:hypothetical protein
MINMAILANTNEDELNSKLNTSALKVYADEPLLLQIPSLQDPKLAIKNIVSNAV